MGAEPLEGISPVQRLLLQSVLLEGDAAVDAFGEWRSRLDIENIDRQSQRLMPLLARRLEEVGPDDPVRALVRGMYRHAWVKNQLAIRQAAPLAAALRRGGVRTLALKGAALVPYYGGDWGRRPMYDVDLLVPLSQLGDAVSILAEEGCHPKSGRSREWLFARMVSRRHSTAFVGDSDFELDLHWHVLAESLGATADTRFWKNAVPFELAGVDVLALDRPDLLLHVIAHGLSAATPDQMQWIVDAVQILRSAEDSSLAARLSESARDHGQVATVRAGLEAIRDLLAEPRVEPALAQLSRTRATVLERLSTSSSRSPNGPQRVLAAVQKHGGGDEEGVISAARAAVRARLELDLVRRQMAFLAYVLSGRRAAVGAIARRLVGTFVRTPSGSTAYSMERELDFALPPTADDHAALGWVVDSRGIRSRGREARIVLDVEDPPGGDVDLFMEIEAATAPTRVDLRVNEKTLTRLDLAEAGTGTLEPVRVQVPAAVAWRLRPLEIAIVAPPSRRRLHRGTVYVRVRGLRLSVSR